jgi:transcriptional regulator GlxA family with amidase domain
MTSQLSCFNDWEATARLVRYQPRALAAQHRISRRQLQRCFAAQFRTQPNKWVEDLRLRDAKQLLAKGSSVEHVAGAMGFADARHFAQWFERLCGCPPHLYPRLISE